MKVVTKDFHFHFRDAAPLQNITDPVVDFPCILQPAHPESLKPPRRTGSTSTAVLTMLVQSVVAKYPRIQFSAFRNALAEFSIYCDNRATTKLRLGLVHQHCI